MNIKILQEINAFNIRLHAYRLLYWVPAYFSLKMHNIIFNVKKFISTHADSRLIPWLIFTIVFLLGLGVTTNLWRYAQQQQTNGLRIEFESAADQAANNIRARINAYEVVMRGVKGYFDGSEYVSLQEFRAYVQSLDIPTKVSGVQGIGLVMPVSHADKDRHIAEQRKQGLSNYQIKPEGKRDYYAPILYMEPMVRANSNAIGFDTQTVPEARTAMEQSLVSGKVTITSHITLMQDVGKPHTYAFVMYLPIFHKDRKLNTLADRRTAIQAWVDVPFRVNDLMNGLRGEFASDIDIEIHDGVLASDQTRMYHSDNTSFESRLTEGMLQTKRYINIAGRKWMLLITTTPHFENRVSNTHQSTIIMWAGIAITLTLSWLAWLLTRGQQVARSRYRKLFDQAGDGVLVLSQNHCFIDANAAALQLLGYTRKDLLNMRLPDILSRHELFRLDSNVGNMLPVTPYQDEWMHVRKDGTEFLAEVSSRLLDGGSYFVILRDLTERKLADNDLRIAAIAFESQEGMMITDANIIILRVNKSFTKITGYLAEEVIGQTPRLLSSNKHHKDFYMTMWENIASTDGWEGEIWNKRKNGEVYPQYLTISAVRGAHGNITNYVASFTDISQHNAAKEKIHHLAFYDTLTRLPNRHTLIDRLHHAMSSNARLDRGGALLFIDLDHFKLLNDSLGHDVGDLLLQQVAERLNSCVRESDTVARLGGDEFMVMLEDLSKQTIEAAAQAKAISNNILSVLNQPYQLIANTYQSAASIGVVLFSGHDLPHEVLLQQADIAMYQAKKTGRNAVCFFDPNMQDIINNRVSLENDLRQAINNQQFQLYYQIQVNHLGHPLGAEALIRWLHPERGIIPPLHFIPLAEEAGLILPIGQWVLNAACAQLKIWQQNPSTHELSLSVNVSAKQFHQVDFVHQVQAAVRDHAINPMLLKLELTESMLVDNIENIITTMNTLKNIGVRLELDDFGTGYSSLQYLKRLPLYQLKIDQSFVRDIVTDSSDKAIVHTIIVMAQSLNLEVIAEGVETENQRQILLSMGCTHFQGYLFSKPLPVQQFEKLLKP